MNDMTGTNKQKIQRQLAWAARLASNRQPTISQYAQSELIELIITEYPDIDRYRIVSYIQTIQAAQQVIDNLKMSQLIDIHNIINTIKEEVSGGQQT